MGRFADGIVHGGDFHVGSFLEKVLPEARVCPNLRGCRCVASQDRHHFVVDHGVGLGEVPVDFLKNKGGFLLQTFELEGRRLLGAKCTTRYTNC